MFRSSRNIVLTLLGSAALFGCCFTGCVDRQDEPERDANGNIVHDTNGNVVYRHHYYYRPWFYTGTGYYTHGYPFWHSSPYSFTPSSPGRGGGGSAGGIGGGSRPGSGTTSRGGFGSTGHATAGS